MTGYTKLFSSIVTSTIWRESKETKVLWITMLALADKNGVVEGSVPGLADMARLSINEALGALEALLAPDEYSRTKDFDGRRVEPVDGGWKILNHAKYRAKMNSDERREYLRVKQQEYRDRRKQSVNKHSEKSTLSTHAKADAKAKAEEAAPPAPAREDLTDWGAMTQEQAMAKLEQDFADIDVWGEYQRFKDVRAQANRKPDWRGLIAWLKKASPIADLGKKKPRPQLPGGDPEHWQEFLRENFTEENHNKKYSDSEILHEDFRRWMKKKNYQ